MSTVREAAPQWKSDLRDDRGRFAASLAFMLPVATAPNAVVFGSGYPTVPKMVRAGGWLTHAATVVITLAAVVWVPIVRV